MNSTEGSPSTQGTLCKVIWFVQDVAGVEVAASLEQRALAGEDYITEGPHTLYKQSGVWWYRRS